MEFDVAANFAKNIVGFLRKLEHTQEILETAAKAEPLVKMSKDLTVEITSKRAELAKVREDHEKDLTETLKRLNAEIKVKKAECARIEANHRKALTELEERTAATKAKFDMMNKKIVELKESL
jgi:predicted  nucleic acid-binding Zn-ribbon protein